GFVFRGEGLVPGECSLFSGLQFLLFGARSGILRFREAVSRAQVDEGWVDMTTLQILKNGSYRGTEIGTRFDDFSPMDDHRSLGNGLVGIDMEYGVGQEVVILPIIVRAIDGESFLGP